MDAHTSDEQMVRRAHVRSAELAGLQVVFFFVLPIVLLYFGIIPVSARIYTLLFVSVLLYGIVKKEGWTSEDVGLTVKNFKKFFGAYFFATIAAMVAIIEIARMLGVSSVHEWWSNPHFLFLFVVVSFFQELVFRGILMPLLGKIFPDSFMVILVNAVLFAGMHAIYPNPEIGLPFAFIGGIFFAGLYRRYPNLYLVSISHAVLNFLAVWYGLFTIR
jgi:membrane protease YdiL (CAAX protease family)